MIEILKKKALKNKTIEYYFFIAEELWLFHKHDLDKTIKILFFEDKYVDFVNYHKQNNLFTFRFNKDIASNRLRIFKDFYIEEIVFEEKNGVLDLQYLQIYKIKTKNTDIFEIQMDARFFDKTLNSTLPIGMFFSYYNHHIDLYFSECINNSDYHDNGKISVNDRFYKETYNYIAKLTKIVNEAKDSHLNKIFLEMFWFGQKPDNKQNEILKLCYDIDICDFYQCINTKKTKNK